MPEEVNSKHNRNSHFYVINPYQRN